jgi:hypothetical protein
MECFMAVDEIQTSGTASMLLGVSGIPSEELSPFEMQALERLPGYRLPN